MTRVKKKSLFLAFALTTLFFLTAPAYLFSQTLQSSDDNTTMPAKTTYGLPSYWQPSYGYSGDSSRFLSVSFRPEYFFYYEESPNYCYTQSFAEFCDIETNTIEFRTTEQTVLEPIREEHHDEIVGYEIHTKEITEIEIDTPIPEIPDVETTYLISPGEELLGSIIIDQEYSIIMDNGQEYPLFKIFDPENNLLALTSYDSDTDSNITFYQDKNQILILESDFRDVTGGKFYEFSYSDPQSPENADIIVNTENPIASFYITDETVQMESQETEEPISLPIVEIYAWDNTAEDNKGQLISRAIYNEYADPVEVLFFPESTIPELTFLE